jgi:hypothetical protein
VTVRTREPDLPSEFPPARLFLDDIEEIVRTLVDANKDLNPSGRRSGDDKLKVELTIKDQVCDAVEDLPKIAKKATELWISLEWESGFTACTLTFQKGLTFLSSFYLDREGHLGLYHKLTPIFNRRKRWLARFVLENERRFLTLAFITNLIASLALFALLRHYFSTGAAVVVVLVEITVFFFLTFAFQPAYNQIILHRWAEHHTQRQEKKWKLIPVVVSSILGFIVGLLTSYVKCKYWP